VPFYQPLAALEYFERALYGRDIASGKFKPEADYLSKGTAKSTYREGNSTMQFKVLSTNSTYPPSPSGGGVKKRKRGMNHAGRKMRPARKRGGR